MARLSLASLFLKSNFFMRKIKALIYALLGGMIAWGYWQRGDAEWAIFISLFTLVIIALTLSSIGRLKISWDDGGITLVTFPKKPRLLLWQDLEKVSLDHLGYHVQARDGQFKIRKNVMPDDLLRRIKENIRINAKAYK
jgi:hypothetical protein